MYKMKSEKYSNDLIRQGAYVSLPLHNQLLLILQNPFQMLILSDPDFFPGS